MGKSTLILSVLGALFAVSLAYPQLGRPQFVRPNYDNIPQCMQPKEPGLCLAYFLSYYYNPSTGTCEQFVYGGCQGNANRFATIDECIAKCGNFKPENREFKLILEEQPNEKLIESEESHEEADGEPSVSNEEQSVSSEEQSVSNEQQGDPCIMPLNSGPCRAMVPRFYFAEGKCESFIYGGCQGNGNNFKTVEECEKRCGTASAEQVASDSNERTAEELAVGPDEKENE